MVSQVSDVAHGPLVIFATASFNTNNGICLIRLDYLPCLYEIETGD